MRQLTDGVWEVGGHQFEPSRMLYGFILALWLLAAAGCFLDQPPPDPGAMVEETIGEPFRVLTLPYGLPLDFRPGYDPPVLLTGDDAGGQELFLWDVRSGKRTATLMTSKKGLAGLRWDCARFNPDGSLLALRCRFSHHLPEFGICLWDVKMGKTRILTKIPIIPTGSGPRLAYHLGNFAFSPDGKLLATGGPGDQLDVWEVATGKLFRRMAGAESYPLKLAFSPDGSQLAAVIRESSDNVVHIWEIASGKQIRILKTIGWMTDVAFSPDGRLIATADGNKDPVIDLWDAVSGEHKATLRGHMDCIRRIVFRNDGRWLASASFDGTVRIWDIHRNKLAHTLTVGGKDVQDVVFSSNGRWLAAQHLLEEGQEVIIWDLERDPTK